MEADEDAGATLHSLAPRTLMRGAPMIITGSKDAVNQVVHHAHSLDCADGWAWCHVELYDVTKRKGKYQLVGGVAAIATKVGLKTKIPNYVSADQGEFWFSTEIAVAGWILKVMGLRPHAKRNGSEEPLWVLFFSKLPFFLA